MHTSKRIDLRQGDHQSRVTEERPAQNHIFQTGVRNSVLRLLHRIPNARPGTTARLKPQPQHLIRTRQRQRRRPSTAAAPPPSLSMNVRQRVVRRVT